jgi:hypothetical protein
MGKEEIKNNLVQTKLGLAEKYFRLAKVSKSKPKQRQLLNRVDKYRRQAADASRMK